MECDARRRRETAGIGMLRYVVGTFADGERYVICWRVAMNDRCCCSRSVGVALRWRVTAAVRLEGDSEMMFLGYLGCLALRQPYSREPYT